jgi:hypothetical protein
MQRLRVVPALRERLGDQGCEALTDMIYAANRDARDEVLEACSGRFSAMLTQEISTLRVEVARELASMRVELAGTRVEFAGMRVDIIRWSFVFWVSQLGAMYGLLTYLK